MDWRWFSRLVRDAIAPRACSKARALFEAIWHLTFTVNVTQLGTAPSKRFHLRHGVAYEHDALLTTITHSSGHESLDITGRAVVLAFRLSGIPAEFPNLVADGTVAKAAKGDGFGYINVKSWTPTSQDLLRHFKGERWGTRGLVISVRHKPKPSSLRSAVKMSKRIISNIEKNTPSASYKSDFSMKYLQTVLSGPQWAKDITAEEQNFIKNNLLEPLKTFTTYAKNTDTIKDTQT